jgi:hypothetical protein
MTKDNASDGLRLEYERLLRWYPRAWKERNESVVIGTLLDEAHEAGRDHPTADDRRSLLRGAIAARAVGSGRRSTVAVCALAAGVAFALFYVSAIGWDPAHHYAGYVGPFTNPSVLVGLLLVVALILSLVKLTGLSHLAAVVAALASVGIGLLAWQYSWLGPSQSAVVLFAGLALLGLSSRDGIGLTIRLLAAIPVAAFGSDFVVDLLNPGVADRWILVGLVVASVVMFVLLVWPWRLGRVRPRPERLLPVDRDQT